MKSWHKFLNRWWTWLTFFGLSIRAQSPLELQLRMEPTGWEIVWNVNSVPASPGRITEFEIQRSADLKTWHREGLQRPSGPLDERLRHPLTNLGMQGYFRVVARSRSAAVPQTAQGGAEVFGYTGRFLEELEQVGQITPDQFAALHPQPTYGTGIDWDPAEALFWESLNTALDDKDRDRDRDGNLIGRFDLQLDDREKALVKTNGFVVSERLGTASFAESFYRIWNEDLPVFVSTDSMMQAWHRSYDAMLEELEETSLFFLMERVLNGMADQIPAAAQSIQNGVLKDSLLDADLFLTVARSLLAGTQLPSPLKQAARVAAALSAIDAEQLVLCFDLFGHPRTVDFSQFKVRGHYENSARLRRYFRCVMWLGRTDLRVAGPEFEDCAGVPHKPYERELGTAVVFHHLLQQSGQFQGWLQSERLIQAFVGWTDSMNFGQLNDLLSAAKLTTLADIRDLATLQRLQDQINDGQYGAQDIKSDYFVAPLGPERLALPRSFTVFGQKFVVDSWVTAKVVYDDILWVEGGQTNKIPRRVPSALDVAFAALKNDQVVPDLVARINNSKARSSTNHMVQWRDGLPYQHNLEAVRRVIDAQTPSAWRENIYVGWLDVLRSLSQPTTDARFPEAMRTRAWAMKTVNTQLASWTELRHDTILYAKQSYTPPGACSYPDGYVEPRPEFFARLEQLALRAAELIAALPVQGGVAIIREREEFGGGEKEVNLTTIKERQVTFLEYFAGMIGRLRTMAEKELRQERMSVDDIRFLDRLIQSTRINGAGGPRRYDGWYTRMFYQSALVPDSAFYLSDGAQRWDALVTDVHTDLPCVCGDPGSVLHEGTGNAHLLILAVNHGDEKVVYAGPVFSHYEFELVGPPKRLSDTDWKAQWKEAGFGEFTAENPDQEPVHDWKNLPPHPEWTRSYLVPYAGRP